MSRNEKIAVWIIGIVIALDVLRHFTWHKSENQSASFVPIGMTPYAAVRRRA